MAAFQFYLQSGKKRKVVWVEDDSHVVFGQKFPGKKGRVRRCVVVMQQSVIFFAKFRDEVFAHFHAIAVEHCSSMRN
jgi:hypothetical protein